MWIAGFAFRFALGMLDLRLICCLECICWIFQLVCWLGSHRMCWSLLFCWSDGYFGFAFEMLFGVHFLDFAVGLLVGFAFASGSLSRSLQPDWHLVDSHSASGWSTFAGLCMVCWLDLRANAKESKANQS